MNFRREVKAEEGVNLTPLIDVVFSTIDILYGIDHLYQRNTS